MYETTFLTYEITFLTDCVWISYFKPDMELKRCLKHLFELIVKTKKIKNPILSYNLSKHWE